MKTQTTLLILASTALNASAAIVPFTESFDSSANNWTSGPGAPLTWIASGGMDGSAYVSGSADLNTAGPFGLAVLRGQDNSNASDDAFVGNYLAQGITRVEFDFRHNAGIDLDIALRLAGSSNSPGLAIQTGGLTASGQWTRLSFDLYFGNPLMTLEGPPSLALYEAVMSQIGNLQVSSFRPDGLTSPLLADFDLDNVTITPTPSSAALLGLGGIAAMRRRR